MKVTPIIIMLVGFAAALAHGESNDSMETMTNAEVMVQAKLDDYSRTGNYKVLVEAGAIASSMNPRQRDGALSELDERCLRLQLKTLMAVQNERDLDYDPKALKNAVRMNISPPDNGGQGVMAGMSPDAIRDPVARKTYEDAIERNNRRNEKQHRERGLSDCADRAVIDIYWFIRNVPEASAARTRAFQIIRDTVTDKTIVERLESEEHPGSTWGRSP